MTDIERLKAARGFILERLRVRFPWLKVDETGLSMEVRGVGTRGFLMVVSVVDPDGPVSHTRFHRIVCRFGIQIAVGVSTVQLLHRNIERITYCGGESDVEGVRDDLLDLLDSCNEEVRILRGASGDYSDDSIDMFVSWVIQYIEEPTCFVFAMMLEFVILVQEYEIDDAGLNDAVLQEFNDLVTPNDWRVVRFFERYLSQNVDGSDMEPLLDRLDAIEGLDIRSPGDQRRWWREWWLVVLSVLHPEKVNGV